MEAGNPLVLFAVLVFGVVLRQAVALAAIIAATQIAVYGSVPWRTLPAMLAGPPAVRRLAPAARSRRVAP